MKTGFACPTCHVPLVLKCTAVSMGGFAVELDVAPCPNPFCRADLPARRHDMTLAYALVGTGREEIEPAR